MIRKYKGKIITTVLIVLVLSFAFWYGGGAPGLQGWDIPGPRAQITEGSDLGSSQEADGDTDGADALNTEEEPLENDGQEGNGAKEDPEEGEAPAAPDQPAPGRDAGRPLTASEKMALAESLAGGKSSAGVEKGDSGYSQSQGMEIDSKTGKDRYLTDPVPEGKPVPVEPQNTTISDKALTCTLSVRCDTILDNISWLDKEKVELVPADGVIYAEKKVTFYEGESVFNVLQREMKKAGIHMEFSNVPIYNSAYIEGINNLYEFDCGELSGWMYKVNGWFPNYGCSRYRLQDGDKIEWVYTCDLGVDVGGYYSVGS